MKGIQYTIRGVPEKLDNALREEAASAGKSLNALLVEKLAQSSRLTDEPWTNGLEEFSGCMEPDPGFDEAIKEFDQIHPDDWK